MTPVDTGRMYRIDANGAFDAAVLLAQCNSSVTTASPLYIRLLLPRHALQWPQTDSLNYDTCVQGVHSRIASSITWLAPHLDTTRTTWTQPVQILGRLVADSSRTLPLHLRATLQGSAELTYPLDTGHVILLDAKLSFTLEAGSSVKTQQVQQIISIKATRQ
jgi:hypothetical protein